MRAITRHAYRLSATIVTVLYRVGFIAALGFAAFVVYRLLIGKIFDDDGFIVPFILLWVVTSYIVLPRVHRWLTKFYIPNYFVGRTRTGDGFYGDPVNVAFNGPEKKLHAAMRAAGWTIAEELNWKSSLKMVKFSILKKSYPHAPVSSLYLFSRKQDFAYQQEVNGNPHARHHVRFWATPKKWWLPGGRQADWLAAGTYDKSVGFSTLTGQITHKIEENTDEERDYIIKTLKDAGVLKNINVVKHFTSAFHDKNGGGDMIRTDGSLPFIDLK